MASLSAPATTEQMIQEQLKERDRMMTQSIQALAMDRLRSSVRSLSRETEFQNRPVVESFGYAPLYIPRYLKWNSGKSRLEATTDGPTWSPKTADEQKIYSTIKIIEEYEKTGKGLPSFTSGASLPYEWSLAGIYSSPDFGNRPDSWVDRKKWETGNNKYGVKPGVTLASYRDKLMQRAQEAPPWAGAPNPPLKSAAKTSSDWLTEYLNWLNYSKMYPA